MEWVQSKESLPPCGAPVLIRTRSVVQHITYMFNNEISDGWFEPYYFESDDELMIRVDKVEEWAFLPD